MVDVDPRLSPLTPAETRLLERLRTAKPGEWIWREGMVQAEYSAAVRSLKWRGLVDTRQVTLGTSSGGRPRVECRLRVRE